MGDVRRRGGFALDGLTLRHLPPAAAAAAAPDPQPGAGAEPQPRHVYVMELPAATAADGSDEVERCRLTLSTPS